MILVNCKAVSYQETNEVILAYDKFVYDLSRNYANIWARKLSVYETIEFYSIYEAYSKTRTNEWVRYDK